MYCASCEIDLCHGWQVNTGAKKRGCKLDGSVWFPNRSVPKVYGTICRTRSTKPSVKIILTNPVYERIHTSCIEHFQSTRKFARRDPSPWLRGSLWPRRLLGRYSSLADSGHGVSYNDAIVICNPILFAICTSTFSKLCKNVYSGM
jgi:hypothetical protein